MDDSNVVTFGPHLNETHGDAEATIHENEIDAQGTEIFRRTERMMAEARAEIRLRMDRCFSDFSSDMSKMFEKFEKHTVDTRSTPILGRGNESSINNNMGPDVRHDKDDQNNSHFSEVRRSKSEISCKIKPQIYDGSDDLEEYLTQFDLLAELNVWDSKTKALLLASSLSGNARAILNEITNGERHDFDCLVTALKSRFGSINRSEVFRAELQTRVRFRQESLPELAQAIKKLTRKAYPGTSSLVRDTLALDYFIDAIPEADIRLRLREVGPKTIGEAENISVRLEALRLADKQKGRSIRTAVVESSDDTLKSDLRELKDGMKTLQNEVNSINRNNNSQQNRGGNFQRNQNNNGFGRNQNNRNFQRSGNQNGNFDHNRRGNQRSENEQVSGAQANPRQR